MSQLDNLQATSGAVMPCHVSQAWQAIGGKGWLYSDDCLDELRSLAEESLGVGLSDSMPDKVLDRNYHTSMSMAPIYTYYFLLHVLWCLGHAEELKLVQ